jgi:MutL-like protein
VFIHNHFAAYILTPGHQTDEQVQALRPRKPKLFLDASYLLYAVGLLSKDHSRTALRLFKKYLHPIEMV